MAEWRTVLLALADDIAIGAVVAAALVFLAMGGIMAPLAAALVGAAAFLVLAVIAYKSTVALLMEPKVGISPVGRLGTALTELEPAGTVLVEGERWQAVSSIGVKKGATVVVLSARGLRLTVEPVGPAETTA